MTIGTTGTVGVTATATITNPQSPNTRCWSHINRLALQSINYLKGSGGLMRVADLPKISLAAVAWFILFLVTRAAIQEVVAIYVIPTVVVSTRDSVSARH